MRGTSDLESVWETRLAWSKKEHLVTIESEHREVESSGPHSYRIGWDHHSRAMRFDLDSAEQEAKGAAYRREHGHAVFAAVGGHRNEVLAIVRRLREEGE